MRIPSSHSGHATYSIQFELLAPCPSILFHVMNDQSVQFLDAILKSAESSSKCLAGVTKAISLQVQPSKESN